MAKTRMGVGGEGAEAAPDAEERRPRPNLRKTRARQCPQCSVVYVEEIRYCPQDGAALHAAAEDQEIPDHADPYEGKVLADRYRVEHAIGEGGMGVVYKAHHVGIGKDVALKILRSSFVDREDVVARFQREAQSASLIGHGNIVEVLDFGKLADGGIYIAMELLEGRDLADVIEMESPVDLEELFPVVEQTCEALHAAHAKGIVHRDLKPENIFLHERITARGPEEIVKVLDFGIAKFTGADASDGPRLTQTGSVFGTPEYMAPEQAAGKQVDGRADQYAFGIILYELITGDVPFYAETFMGVLSKHLFETPAPMRSIRPDLKISIKVERVIQRMLAKKPGDRYDTMGDALQALRDAMGRAGAAAPAAPLEDNATTTTNRRAAKRRAETKPSDLHAPPAPAPAPVHDALLDEPEGGSSGWMTYMIVAILVAAGLGLLYLGLDV